MKNTALICASVLAMAAVSAQANTEIDTDGDGVFSYAELLIAFPDMTEETFHAADANGDGAIDAEEMNAAQASALLPVTEG